MPLPRVTSSRARGEDAKQSQEAGKAFVINGRNTFEALWLARIT